ncbi:hypothetical protein NDU88_005092 [Pleurodeles waltl]|uniref:KRAB domain-containing protein n=1 Tax=Pleurodeles waltl TaxID=8319 RepID=A0AAV7N090_PLEWA|nr:hypothetical protein NDU88_005092 [Pleurodeles waltl]
MFCQDQEGVHAIFPDASAYFSEEEWKPLHKWQKDLYRNVMMEIHKALISLGPLIATTMFSLRSQEIEQLISMDHQDSERRHSMRYSHNDVISNPDVTFRVNRRKQQYPKTSQDIERREKNDSVNTGMAFFRQNSCLKKEEPISILIDDLGDEARDSNSNHKKEQETISFRIKGEKDTHCMDQPNTKRRENFSSDTDGAMTNSDLLFRINRQQEEQYLETSQHTEDKERNDCLSTGVTFFNADICLMKEEEPVSILIDDLGNEVGEGSTDHNTGDGPTTTKWKAEEGMKCIEKIPTQKNVLVKTKDRRVPRGTSRSDPRSITHANPEEEGCCGTMEGERGDTRKSGQEGRQDRKNNKDGVEVRELLKAAGSERTKESGEESGEAKRARETEFPAEDEQTPKDAEITHHVPRGTWLMQLQAYFQNPSTYFGNGKGKGGSLKEI